MWNRPHIYCNMVSIDLNWHGYSFQHELDIIESSYSSAEAKLYELVKSAKDKLLEYEKSGECNGEYDEDGHLIWDECQTLEMNVSLAERASMALRKSFAISTYHLW